MILFVAMFKPLVCVLEIKDAESKGYNQHHLLIKFRYLVTKLVWCGCFHSCESTGLLHVIGHSRFT